MEIILETIITYSFYALAFLVPLILASITSEVFEFNKIITLYALTTVIVATWLGRMVINRKFLFKKSLLDIPLLIFLASQLLSTVFSIDFRTSLLGYYSRFNGGFMSILCYALLFWAFVSNFDRKKTLSFIYAIFASGILVSVYGILEHFGIDKNIWVQDVQTRVFSSLGQPNWLAAWLVALIPLTWAFSLKEKIKSRNFWLWNILSLLFFITFLFTKSRSGLAGFIVADTLFWSLTLFTFLKEKSKLKTSISLFLLTNLVILVLSLAIDSPWRSSALKVFNRDSDEQQTTKGPALEVGGTESGEIRKIVWKGAIDIWKHYSIFGSGVETFAFSYYEFRPAAHNLVSEWDYLYNKAHNEYLNYLATTGIVGLFSYLILVGIILLLFLRELGIKNNELGNEKVHNSYFIIQASLLAGFASILISNIWGFSVVPTSLLFFIFPAISLTINDDYKNSEKKKNNLELSPKIILAVLIFVGFYAIFLISRYWLADVYYAKAKSAEKSGDYLSARKSLVQSIKLSRSEAIYLNELAQVDGALALILYDNQKFEEAKQLVKLVEQEEFSAESLSPRNVNIKRDAAANLTKLSIIDSSLLPKANQILIELEKLAPTEPKIKLNLAISYLKLGQRDKTKDLLDKAILLKPNYKDVRYARAAILADEKKNKEALAELEYILTNIDPKDEASKNLKEVIQKGN